MVLLPCRCRRAAERARVRVGQLLRQPAVICVQQREAGRLVLDVALQQVISRRAALCSGQQRQRLSTRRAQHSARSARSCKARHCSRACWRCCCITHQEHLLGLLLVLAQRAARLLGAAALERGLVQHKHLPRVGLGQLLQLLPQHQHGGVCLAEQVQQIAARNSSSSRRHSSSDDAAVGVRRQSACSRRCWQAARIAGSSAASSIAPASPAAP